jgi:2-desacetyl-2-hydroxyethyl bacteriochlorophyllide A dehydrogenase
MSFAEGALVEPLAVCYRACVQAGVTFQDRVAVFGGGTIGLLSLAVAKAIGVRETLIVVKYKHQAQMARALGADHVVNVTDTDVRQYVADITGGLGMDAIIETTGSASAFNDSLAIIRKRGRVALVGGYHKPLEIDLSKLVWAEPVVTGSNCYAYSGMIKDFDAAIDLISSGKVDATQIVTHHFALDEIAQAFEIAADKKSGSIKVHVLQ